MTNLVQRLEPTSTQKFSTKDLHKRSIVPAYKRSRTVATPKSYMCISRHLFCVTQGRVLLQQQSRTICFLLGEETIFCLVTCHYT